MLLCTSYFIKKNLLRVTWAIIVSIEFVYLVILFVSHIKKHFTYSTFLELLFNLLYCYLNIDTGIGLTPDLYLLHS